MTYETLKDIGGFMRKASEIRCNIDSKTVELIKFNYDVNSKEAARRFSLLPTENQFLLIWKLVNRGLIEEAIFVEATFQDLLDDDTFEEAFPISQAKETFKDLVEEIGDDDGAYALCAVIFLHWFSSWS